MNFLNDYLTGVFGDRSMANWAVSLTFVLIGAIVSLRLIAFTRDKTSDSTPYYFSLWFMIRDNAPRTIGSIFVAFSFIRFGEELGWGTASDFGCFTLGLLFDVALYLLSDWSSKARDKFKNK